jgi:hypothetical protein
VTGRSTAEDDTVKVRAFQITYEDVYAVITPVETDASDERHAGPRRGAALHGSATKREAR